MGAGSTSRISWNSYASAFAPGLKSRGVAWKLLERTGAMFELLTNTGLEGKKAGESARRLLFGDIEPGFSELFGELDLDGTKTGASAWRLLDVIVLGRFLFGRMELMRLVDVVCVTVLSGELGEESGGWYKCVWPEEDEGESFMGSGCSSGAGAVHECGCRSSSENTMARFERDARSRHGVKLPLGHSFLL